MPMYNLTNEDKRCTVKLSGPLIVREVPELQEALKGAINSGAMEIEFDFSNTTMLDSSGIGLLVATSNSLAQKKGTVRLINVSVDIMKLLQSMRLVGRLNAVGK